MRALLRACLTATLFQMVVISAAAQSAATGAPLEAKDAGAFRATRLSQPPTIDGREWIAASVFLGSASTEVRNDFGAFAVIFKPVDGDTGDFERYALYVQRGRAEPVLINELTSWAYVSPDRRFIIAEPLYVLDVRQWKQYPLFEALRIPNYTSIEAISRDGRRLLVSRSDCAMDCSGEGRDYYELLLPP